MNTVEHESVAKIFEQWTTEDALIEDATDALLKWMREVQQQEFPKFRETAAKLTPYRTLLAQHFAREDEMLVELASHYSADSPEIAAIGRQSQHDHDNLLGDLDDFMQRLDHSDPPFATWQLAINEFDQFFCRLEIHEEQESDSMKCLMPTKN